MDSFSFVLGYYQDGLFNCRKAYQKLVGKRRPVIVPWLVTAAAAIAVGVFLFAGYSGSRKEYYAYDVNQAFVLPDGSEVMLYPGSSLTLQPHRNPRVVEMSGKVRFTVAKDEAHPFTVSSKNAFVEVLGTVFTLSDNPAKVEVEQGCVRFARSAAAEGIVLTKGESAEIRGGVPQRMGAFAFDDTPLEDVIASLSEFYGVRLRCNTLGKRLSAEFRGECLEDIVGLIEDALDVRIIVEE